MKTQGRLLARYLASAPQGEITWLGVREQKKAPMTVLSAVRAISGQGLEGDHKARTNNGSSRQITLINAEDIHAISLLLKRDAIDPAILRRNMVVSGMNLHALRYQRLRIGNTAEVEIRAHCHPCVRMEKALGEGAVLAMYQHAGYCAVVLESGEIRVGDKVTLLPTSSSTSVKPNNE